MALQLSGGSPSPYVDIVKITIFTFVKVSGLKSMASNTLGSNPSFSASSPKILA